MEEEHNTFQLISLTMAHWNYAVMVQRTPTCFTRFFLSFFRLLYYFTVYRCISANVFLFSLSLSLSLSTVFGMPCCAPAEMFRKGVIMVAFIFYWRRFIFGQTISSKQSAAQPRVHTLHCNIRTPHTHRLLYFSVGIILNYDTGFHVPLQLYYIIAIIPEIVDVSLWRCVQRTRYGWYRSLAGRMTEIRGLRVRQQTHFLCTAKCVYFVKYIDPPLVNDCHYLILVDERIPR